MPRNTHLPADVSNTADIPLAPDAVRRIDGNLFEPKGAGPAIAEPLLDRRTRYAYRCAECGATVAIPIMAPDDAPYACEECGRSLTVAEWDREETER